MTLGSIRYEDELGIMAEPEGPTLVNPAGGLFHINAWDRGPEPYFPSFIFRYFAVAFLIL